MTNISGPLRRLAHASPDGAELSEIERFEAVRDDLARCDDPIGDVFEASGGGATSTVASESAIASVPAEKAILLYRLVRALRPRKVVEFGSALGLSGSCIVVALDGNGSGDLVTVEGSPSRHKVASRSISSVDGSARAKTVCAMFDDALDVLDGADLFFLDGNHYFEPTLRYVNEAVKRMATPATFVLDDVRWSAEMLRAWENLSQSRRFVAAGEVLGLGLLCTGRIPLGLTPTPADRIRAALARTPLARMLSSTRR